MKFTCPHFRTGVALTCFLALIAMQLDHLPFFVHLGPLSIALLTGMLARALLHIPEEQHAGINFSAKQLLRIGTILIGVRLNFALIFHAGPTILLLACSIVAGGLFFITWLGKYWKLPSMLSLLIAIDSSICGGSAVAVIAPTIGAKEEETALVIPLCSLIGMTGMFTLSAARHFFNLAPATFGLLSGASLHEVAQVMAAVSSVPEAIEIGTATKFARVLLLAPVLLFLSWRLSRHQKEKTMPFKKINARSLVNAIWFVFCFLLLGTINTVALRFFPMIPIKQIDHQLLILATFIIAVAMAGIGLQVNFYHLKKKGLHAAGVAIIGWLFLVLVAAIEIYFMKLLRGI